MCIYIADTSDKMFDFVLDYDHKEFLAELRQNDNAPLANARRGEANGFYGKTHSPEVKANSGRILKKVTQTKIACKYCSKEISQHNMSRHLYSCTNGKEGTKGNATRKGIKLNTSNWTGTLKTITNGKRDRRIKHADPVPEGWYIGSCRKGTKYKTKSL